MGRRRYPKLETPVDYDEEDGPPVKKAPKRKDLAKSVASSSRREELHSEEETPAPLDEAAEEFSNRMYSICGCEMTILLNLYND